MNSRAKQAVPTSPFDKVLVAAIAMVLFFGLLMVASASIGISERQFGTPFYFLIRQLIFLLIVTVLSHKS